MNLIIVILSVIILIAALISVILVLRLNKISRIAQGMRNFASSEMS